MAVAVTSPSGRLVVKGNRQRERATERERNRQRERESTIVGEKKQEV